MSESELTLDDALDEMHGWNRILSGYQGQETGFKAAVALLRQASGEAFAKGDDDEAASLRAHAALLESSDAVKSFRAEAEEAYRKQEHWREKAAELEAVAP